MVIPDEIKADAQRVVSDFNAKVFPDPTAESYVIRFRGRHLYLDRTGTDFRVPCHVCRLSYTGDPSDWDFAIYKYSNDKYDPEEWMFPGAGHVDGTIEGALSAGMEAYG